MPVSSTGLTICEAPPLRRCRGRRPQSGAAACAGSGKATKGYSVTASTPGATYGGNDFGNVQLASISGHGVHRRGRQRHARTPATAASAGLTATLYNSTTKARPPRPRPMPTATTASRTERPATRTRSASRRHPAARTRRRSRRSGAGCSSGQGTNGYTFRARSGRQHRSALRLPATGLDLRHGLQRRRSERRHGTGDMRSGRLDDQRCTTPRTRSLSRQRPRATARTASICRSTSSTYTVCERRAPPSGTTGRSPSRCRRATTSVCGTSRHGNGPSARQRTAQGLQTKPQGLRAAQSSPARTSATCRRHCGRPVRSLRRTGAYTVNARLQP